MSTAGESFFDPELDALFDRWIATYPENQRSGFHRDGIVCPGTFRNQMQRILYVLLEPNSSEEGIYSEFVGRDLREIFGWVCLGKQIDINLAAWTERVPGWRESFLSA